LPGTEGETPEDDAKGEHMRAQRLSGSKLEDAIDRIEDANARDAVYELLMRARDAVRTLTEQVSGLEAKVRRLEGARR
jgi:hypothetical protein